MKLVNFQSKKWFWSRLWISHTVLISWDYVLSYELKKLFWPWAYKLYNRYDYEKQVWKITFTQNLPDIDLTKYAGRTNNWVWCYEALVGICKENNIDIMETVNNRTRKIAITAWIIISYCLWFYSYNVIDNLRYNIIIIDNVQEEDQS